MKPSALIAIALLASGAVIARAEEKAVVLKAGAGREMVDANCAGCHSLDYIGINSVFMTRKVWDAEVTKMVKAFGAPIAPNDAATIIDYLAQNYGKAD